MRIQNFHNIGKLFLITHIIRVFPYLKRAIRIYDYTLYVICTVIIYVFCIKFNRNLRTKKQDFSRTLAEVYIVSSGLEALRKNFENRFKQIFNDVFSLASNVNTEIKSVYRKRTNRANVQTNKSRRHQCVHFLL